jgi:hypothetical protein
MKLRDWLANWNLSSLKFSVGFLDAEWRPDDQDRLAAWDLYVEMLTRIVTQPLPDADGDEKTALDSVHSLFATTRAILKERGPGAVQFAKLAIVVLNQMVRPFTAKWHKLSLAGAFAKTAPCAEFRNDLAALQKRLLAYARALANVAGVEDLTRLEEA